ncbi:MAG: GtrA family protein [Actinomycetota bacterium]|nr:GtrA family protein [Actinomycetota bacterium]
MAEPEPPNPSIAHIWGSDAPLIQRVRHVIRHPSSLKLIKYASVSVISTVCSQVVLLLTFGVFRVMSEVPANVLANVVGTVPSYSLNRRWVWGKSGQSHFWREVVPFWVLSFVGLGFSSLAVWLAGDFSRDHHLSHPVTSLLVNAANLVSFAILWIVKFLIYERLFHIDPVELPLGEERSSDTDLVGS